MKNIFYHIKRVPCLYALHIRAGVFDYAISRIRNKNVIVNNRRRNICRATSSEVLVPRGSR